MAPAVIDRRSTAGVRPLPDTVGECEDLLATLKWRRDVGRSAGGDNQRPYLERRIAQVQHRIEELSAVGSTSSVQGVLAGGVDGAAGALDREPAGEAPPGGMDATSAPADPTSPPRRPWGIL